MYNDYGVFKLFFSYSALNGFHYLILLLRQLLLDCGIGISSEDGSNSNFMTDPVVSQHRALIFFQLKSMLDIVENDLLK